MLGLKEYATTALLRKTFLTSICFRMLINPEVFFEKKKKTFQSLLTQPMEIQGQALSRSYQVFI
jgi:hypothetical protein